jgi:3-carboxy-cis,cis-muconate cycloisomerase
MPQKANPIDSEAVVGLSIVAAQQVPALLAAMQGAHERSAGEWQAEWDALPLLAAAAAGAVAGARRIVDGLQVFAERMRANLDADGGLIMAEAAMMALAPTLGREAAHDAVYEACAQARADGRSLSDVLGKAVPLDPEQYLGETDAIVTAALEGWAIPAEAGTARR